MKCGNILLGTTFSVDIILVSFTLIEIYTEVIFFAILENTCFITVVIKKCVIFFGQGFKFFVLF